MDVMTDPKLKKRVTAADIARSLGISRATVGFVLNETPGQTISAATRDRVLAEAKRLGYRPNNAARAGRSRLLTRHDDSSPRRARPAPLGNTAPRRRNGHGAVLEGTARADPG